MPLVSDVVSLETPVAAFLAATCAPAITAPEASVTVPERVAPVTCARTGMEVNKQNTKARNTPVATNFFIKFLHISFVPPSPLIPTRTADAALLHPDHDLVKLFSP